MNTLRRTYAASLLVAMTFAAACADAEVASEHVTITDSAGIRIIDNLAPLLPPDSWAVEPEPVAVIGADEANPMHNLFYVEGAIALSDGSVVVANSPAPMLRWYTADGRFLRGAGRPGGGPGEFGGGENASIFSLWPLAADSVATWEHSARRMQVFDPEGRYARSVVIELPRETPYRAFPLVVGRSEAGFLAALTAENREGPVGVRHIRNTSYVLYHPDGTFAHTIATLPSRETMLVESFLPGRPEPVRYEGSVPFSKDAVVALVGDRFYYGWPEAYQIAHYGVDGTLRELIRKRVGIRALTPADVQRDRERARAMAAERQYPRTNPAPGEAPYPDAMPAYSRLRVDRGGHLWVEEYTLPGADRSIWSVFDVSGRWVTDVAIPRGLRIYDIGDDYILAERTSTFDVENVIKLRLLRTG